MVEEEKGWEKRRRDGEVEVGKVRAREGTREGLGVRGWEVSRIKGRVRRREGTREGGLEDRMKGKTLCGA